MIHIRCYMKHHNHKKYSPVVMAVRVVLVCEGVHRKPKSSGPSSLAVMLLILQCLWTILVIIGDWIDRMDSSPSGLRASWSLSGGLATVWERAFSWSATCMQICFVHQRTNPSNEAPWRMTHPFDGLFLLFSWCLWRMASVLNYLQSSQRTLIT